MKIMMVEVNAEELSANRRIADVLIDAVTNFTDAFARGVTAEFIYSHHVRQCVFYILG